MANAWMGSGVFAEKFTLAETLAKLDVEGVSVVSGLAIASDSQGSAQFPVTLSIPQLTPQQLQRVRLGMSARLTIVTYNNAQAMVVPAQAISAGEVEYRQAMDKPVERVKVTTGQSTAQGVEVFGLKPGFVKVSN